MTDETVEKEAIFKQCPACKFTWRDRNALLADPGISVIGYQVNFEELAAGFFLFNHACINTTFLLPVKDFVDLYDGPVFEERKTDSDDCPRYCLHEKILDPCPARCECAFVREVVQIIKNWPKRDDQD